MHVYPILTLVLDGLNIGSWIQNRDVDIIANSSAAAHNPASKDTIGSAAEGLESAESTTKTFGSDGKGLSLMAMTRVGYFDSGDKILYGYVRELRFTEDGHLYYVSGETRVEIDVLVPET
jgi:hypothetical protein